MGRQVEPRGHRQRSCLVSRQDYQLLLAAQNGVCALCFGAPTKRALHLDHDHETGRVRGLLCHGCNLGLGFLKDNIDVILRAVDYLKKTVDIKGGKD